MRPSDKTISFILSHTTKNRAIIRRIEISRRRLNSLAAGSILLMFSFAVGITALINTTDLSTHISSAKQQESITTSEYSATSTATFLDYSRPDSSFDFVQNSGGPYDGSFQLTAVDTQREETLIERRLKIIESTANPRFLPTIWAHLGKINNEFGFRRNPFGGRAYEFHAGMDIDGDRGDIIVAPANGIISAAGWKGGYGYMIEIDHGNGLTTRFGHLSRLEVKEGDPIQRGQLIGFVGSTGRSTGPHLHYELRLDEKPINPRRFLPPEPTELKS